MIGSTVHIGPYQRFNWQGFAPTALITWAGLLLPVNSSILITFVQGGYTVT